MARLYEPTSGRVIIDGDDVAKLAPEPLRKKRPTMQMVFQDPQASLNPRMPVLLHPGQFSLWLASDTKGEALQRAMEQAREDVVAHPVSTRVNDVRNEGEDLLEAVETG